MSRIGNQPINIPSGVTVDINNDRLNIKGPKGTLGLTIPRPIKVNVDDNNINVERPSSDKPIKALHGLSKSLIANCVLGVSEGFQKSLEIVGVGYRAKAQGAKLDLTLGFSHPVSYEVPEGVTVETPSQTEILVKGIDRQAVGQVAADLRRFRPPEPYKGKGVRYSDERISLKEAKKK